MGLQSSKRGQDDEILRFQARWENRRIPTTNTSIDHDQKTSLLQWLKSRALPDSKIQRLASTRDEIDQLALEHAKREYPTELGGISPKLDWALQIIRLCDQPHHHETSS